MKKLLIGLLAIGNISSYATLVTEQDNPNDEYLEIACYSNGTRIFGPNKLYGYTQYGKNINIYKTELDRKNGEPNFVITNASCVIERL